MLNTSLPLFDWLHPDDLLYNIQWWSIYSSSFPKAELDTRPQLLQALEKGIVKIGAYSQEGKVAAIAVLYPMQKLPFAFLHYFAVDASKRNLGLGGRLFDSLVKEHVHDNHLGIMFEVEDPDAASDELEKTQRQHRIDFYLKHSATLLKNKFIQPPVDGKNTVAMRLMNFGADKNIDLAKYENDIAAAIYFEKYQAVNNIESAILKKLLEDNNYN